jgi:hypothetical protein
MKPGTRLKSAACATEVVVIRCGGGTIECGGAAMSEGGGEAAELDPEFANGSIMGKRYVDAAGTIELLCVKPGKGTLAADGVKLLLKEAKPLPASD